MTPFLVEMSLVETLGRIVPGRNVPGRNDDSPWEGRSGGAAFLIPYLIMMVFAGLPVFYLELVIGQYAGLTPHILYRRMSPVFAGWQL